MASPAVDTTTPPVAPPPPARHSGGNGNDVFIDFHDRNVLPLRPVEETHFHEGTLKTKYSDWLDTTDLPEDQKIRAALHQLDRFSFDGTGLEGTVRTAVYGATWTAFRSGDWVFHGTTGFPHGASYVSPVAAYAAATSPFASRLAKSIERRLGKRDVADESDSKGRHRRKSRPLSAVRKPLSRVGKALGAATVKPAWWLGQRGYKVGSKAWNAKPMQSTRARTRSGFAKARFWSTTTAGRFATGVGGVVPTLGLIALFHPSAALPLLGASIPVMNIALAAGPIVGTLRAGLPYLPEKAEEVLHGAVKGIGKYALFGWAIMPGARYALARSRTGRHSIDKSFGRSQRISARTLINDSADELSKHLDGESPRRRRADRNHAEAIPVGELLAGVPESLDDERTGKERLRHLTLAEASELTESMLGPVPAEAGRARADWFNVATRFKQLSRGSIDDLAIIEGEGALPALAFTIERFAQTLKDSGKDANFNFSMLRPRFRRHIAEQLDRKGLDAKHNGLPIVQADAVRMVDAHVAAGGSSISQSEHNRIARELSEHGTYRGGGVHIKKAAMERINSGKAGFVVSSDSIGAALNGSLLGDAVKAQPSRTAEPSRAVEPGRGRSVDPEPVIPSVEKSTNGHGALNGNASRSAHLSSPASLNGNGGSNGNGHVNGSAGSNSNGHAGNGNGAVARVKAVFAQGQQWNPDVHGKVDRLEEGLKAAESTHGASGRGFLENLLVQTADSTDPGDRQSMNRLERVVAVVTDRAATNGSGLNGQVSHSRSTLS